MNDSVNTGRFYAPDLKELGLGISYVLEEAGGVLSFERVAEVLGDSLQIPAEARNQAHARHPSHTEWTYYLAWTCSDLRGKGFMQRNKGVDQGMCALTEAGHELGRWAKRIYLGQNSDLPEWVRAFLRPMRSRMKRLLNSRHARKPPDYELCRWVRYCYLLNWPRLGTGVSNLILKENVDEQLWRQAERQANVMRLRLEETIGVSGGNARANSLQQPIDIETIGRHLKWLLDSFPVGTRLPGINQREDFEICDITKDGLCFQSQKGRRGYLEWKAIGIALIVLFGKGEFTQLGKSFEFRFLTSLLAQVPGAEPMKRYRGVRLSNARDATSQDDDFQESI